VIIAGCLLLVGCNTMAGMGEDMQRAGANLENRATESQRLPPSSPPGPPVEVPAYPDPDQL
jgi:predicted small secreted protein